MGVVAVSAEKIGSLPRTHKVSCSFPVNARLPISVLRPMTFATEPVALSEVDQFTIIKSQFIPVFCIVAIQAPSHRFSMMELDICMFLFQFPLFSVHLQGGMAVTAGENAFCKRWRGHGEILISPSDKRCRRKH
jgi:hypothetical protein